MQEVAVRVLSIANRTLLKKYFESRVRNRCENHGPNRTGILRRRTGPNRRSFSFSSFFSFLLLFSLSSAAPVVLVSQANAAGALALSFMWRLTMFPTQTSSQCKVKNRERIFAMASSTSASAQHLWSKHRINCSSAPQQSWLCSTAHVSDDAIVCSECPGPREADSSRSVFTGDCGRPL